MKGIQVPTVKREPQGETLFDYQREMLPRIADSDRLIIADEPGLGKTPMVLRALAMYFANRPTLERTVTIICPLSAVPVWLAMARVWLPGHMNIKLDVATYGVATRATPKHPIRTPQVLILDEAHYLANPEAQRTVAILGPKGFARTVPVVWALTGTPMQRHAGQLYPLLRGLWPDTFKVTWKQWREVFCTTKQVRRGRKLVEQITGSKNLDRLKPALAKFMIRRTYADVKSQLPELVRIYQPVHIAEQTRPVTTVFAPPRELGLAKVEPCLDAIIRDLQDGVIKRPLIFAWHIDVIWDIVNRLRADNYIVDVITGETPSLRRELVVKQFQGGAVDTHILVCQIAAMETGVTLTAADRVEIIESSWNHSRDDQAIARAHRTGQEKSLIARIWYADGTMDGAVMAAHRVQRRDRQALGI